MGVVMLHRWIGLKNKKTEDLEPLECNPFHVYLLSQPDQSLHRTAHLHKH
jgi:hypothetical protein